jgi:sugar/nucleoside kinase (ribokinase family)
VLAGVDLLFVSEEELRPAGADPRAGLARLAGGRLSLVALKRGPLGGWLYDVRTDRLHAWQPRALATVDPTGAGDAFAAGVLGTLLAAGARPGAACDEALLQQALDLGVVLASFALESWGAVALLEAGPAQVRERRESWFGARSR